MADLVKLSITGYEDAACVAKKKASINAFINPSTYIRNYIITYKNSDEMDAAAPTQVFKRMDESDLKLSFFVDGTGVVPLEKKYKTVDAYITAFTNVVSAFQGNIHRPYFLLISWGSLSFTGVCTNLEVTYTLFSPDGTALRAKIDATFKESVDYSTKAKEAAKKSPDMTHKRIVKAGDSLPLLSYQIYGDSKHYIQVAKKNGLSSFNDIKPGDVLYFHPITSN